MPSPIDTTDERPDRIRLQVILSCIRPLEPVQLGHGFTHRAGDTAPILFSQFFSYIRIAELQARHTWHDDVTPAKDRIGRIEPVGPGHRCPCVFVEPVGEKALLWKLGRIERRTTQDVFALCAGQEYVLAKVAGRDGLGPHERTEVKPVERGLELLMRQRTQAVRVFAVSPFMHIQRLSTNLTLVELTLQPYQVHKYLLQRT